MSVYQYLAQISNVIKIGYRSNAFAPYVWFIAVIAIVDITMLLLIRDLLVTRVLAMTFVLTVMFGMYMFHKIFKKDPKLLQSENFRLEDKKLDLIGKKGSDIHISPVNLNTSTTPLNQGGEDA